MNRLSYGRRYYTGDESLSPSLKEVRTAFECPLFRGQLDSSWPLIDSVSRLSNNHTTEYNRILSALRCTTFREIISSSIFWNEMTQGQVDGEEYNLLDDNRFLAQHYDIPTTLLDYTLDPEIAMYFACTIYDSKTNTTRPLSEKDIVHTA